MQAYSDPSRASEPHALPDVEVFEIDHNGIQGDWRETVKGWMRDDPYALPSDFLGWYWWSCFPGCLPDSDPIGPFDTEAEALADAQSD